MNELSRENYAPILAAFIESNELTVRKTAKAIGCSEPTLARLLSQVTLPSDEMTKQTGIMIEIGFKRFSKLSKAEREKISEAIGSTGGGALGFGSITAAISALGIPGLSGAGITSGLAALGGLFGGGMVVGVIVAAAIPVAGATIGFGLIKGIKYFFSERQLSVESLDPLWETHP